MKTTTILLLSFLSASTAFSQDEGARKFDNQMNWTSSHANVLESNFSINTFRTTRNTYRMEAAVMGGSDYTLAVDIPGADANTFKNKCADFVSKNRFDNVKKISLTMKANPWAQDTLYRVKNINGSFEVLNSKDIENFPVVKDVQAVFTKYNVSTLAYYAYLPGKAKFVSDVQNELSRQFELGREQFLKTGEILFDLSDVPLRYAACDLAYSGAGISFDFELSHEKERAQMKSWLSYKDISSITGDLTAEKDVQDLDLLTAGILLGKSLERNIPEKNVLVQNRRQVLLKTFFDQKSAAEKDFRVKALSENQMINAQRSFNELDLSKPIQTDVHETIGMSELNIVVGE